jgi:hypothetical protein
VVQARRSLPEDAILQKVAGSRPVKVNDFYEFTYSFQLCYVLVFTLPPIEISKTELKMFLRGTRGSRSAWYIELTTSPPFLS